MSLRRSAWGHRLAVSAVAVLCLAVVSTGCTAAGGSGGARIVVEQRRTGISDPISISMVGFQPGQSVVLTATARTDAGTYVSRAVFAVPPDGAVSLGTARPLLGDYAGPDAAGPLWSLSGPSQSQGQLESVWANGDVDVRLAALQNGREVATASVHRDGFAERVTARPVFAGDLIRTTDGGSPGGTTYDVRIGTFYDPDPVRAVRRPAVVVVDGDDGGGSAAFAAAQLAAAGYAAFALPAFGPAGQIPGSSALAVESFDAAVRWLRLQPNVDGGRIFVYGTWRASQLALWLAVNSPGEVYGAVAASGTTALLCTSAAGTPVITAEGVAVPCEDPSRTIGSTALLRLDSIPGPVLLACGEDDETLANACEWLRAGRSVRGERPGDVFLEARKAGHSVSTPPLIPVGLQELGPAKAQATEAARRAFWNSVGDLLHRTTRS
ncbi:acyl-CoA thioesterase/BAAT N-terminal domain-containing protein [Leifsonia sp. NPDC058292]|uniref:acyl-CoA thioesterase/bile acid-CoA:amino acid N-acyltransferase family protein n=1 Tax=Leifsonia sp. NPDC058292 TaxID=3346428 RepID=UPI0036D8E38B